MKLYTKRGDSGQTGILGKDRLYKDDTRIEAYGNVDEVNSLFGLVKHHVYGEFHSPISKIQALLLELGSELASSEGKSRITDADVEWIESLIDQAEHETPPLKSFVLPGGSLGASWLQFLRTVVRRTERSIVSFSKEAELSPNAIPFINRLSDLIFAWARLINHRENIVDEIWESRK